MEQVSAELKPDMVVLKETPLAALHKSLGARMVDFAGWNMPVQYRSIITEHMAVRTKVGLFDVSHMGEFLVNGAGAFDFIQYMIANDLNKLTQPNAALYTQFVRPDGGTVDDLIVYRRSDDFLLVVNASNIEKDWQWLYEHKSKFTDVELLDISNQTALLALQGPNAVPLMNKIGCVSAVNLAPFTYGTGTISGIELSFGRTGYTGEDGFEIFTAAADAAKLWQILMDAGVQFELTCCGLGARDTLRLEAALPLYGHELDDTTSPIQAGLGWSVKLDKDEFLGCQALKVQKKEGTKERIVCLRADGKALPRQGYSVFCENVQVGQITSGSQGIFVGYPIAFAKVDSRFSKTGQQLQVQIRDALVNAQVVTRPFYKRS